ncbi:MAG: LysR family transcriptional regulator [Clostridia bacterium]|nr:LysR family transcriptional regulator [Lachnospiraceae bacterium]NCC00678.1 LysR family transcriptional regulator [Clostridia bacterium]NCD02691.1 LysR family transcriptional regulator [Clostridia bacterium]
MATLKQLKTFIAVAEYKKMSEAARKLYVSQPTVSQIISDLEEEYGLLLFERQPKELKITPAGQTFLSSAQQIIAIHTNLEQNMKNIHSKRPLRIGATLTVGNTLISTLAETLMKDYPDLDISVFIDNTRMIEHRMIHNELDIALVEGIITREEIVTDPIIDDYLCLFCGKEHPLAALDTITVEDLHNQTFIMRERGSGTRAIFENIMLTHHIPFQTKWECSSGTAIIDAVRHNMGLGVLSFRCIEEFVEKGEIQVCHLEGISMKRYFYLCYNKNNPVNSQMLNFIDAAKKMQLPDDKHLFFNK